MKVIRFNGTIVEVKAHFNYAGEHETVYYTYAVDEMPPMDNELYEEYKAEIVRQIKEDLMSTQEIQEIIDKIYFEGFEDSPIYGE